MTDIKQLEADLLAHWGECDDCGDAPEDGCAIAREMREQLRIAKAVRALQYHDEVVARAQERNPEYYRGSPHSAFFTRF